MSKPLRLFKPEDRNEVARHRYLRCDLGRDSRGYGLSGLGYWSAADYLKGHKPKKSKSGSEEGENG